MDSNNNDLRFFEDFYLVIGRNEWNASIVRMKYPVVEIAQFAL